MQPQGLLDHHDEIVEPDDGGFGDRARPLEGFPHLSLRLRHRRRGPDELRHGPVQRRRRGIAARSKHVLEDVGPN